MKRLSLIAAAIATSLAYAQSAEMTGGEIRKVDKDAKKLTIKHGPMPDLDMPAMTMVFQVKDPALLEQFIASYARAPEELVLDFDATNDPVHGEHRRELLAQPARDDVGLPARRIRRDQLDGPGGPGLRLNLDGKQGDKQQ